MEDQRSVPDPVELSLNDRVSMLYNFSHWSTNRLIALSLFIAYFLYGQISDWALIVFIGLNVGIVMWREILRRRFKAINSAGEEILKWGVYFTLTSLANGFIWGGACFFFMMATGQDVALLMSVAIIGMSAMSLVLNSTFLPALFAFAIPAMSGLTLSFLLKVDVDRKSVV